MKFYINISLITLLFFVGLFEAAAQHVPAVTHQKKFPLTRAGFISTTASPSLTCDDGEVLGWKDGERICIPKDSFELAGIHFPDCNGEDFLIVSQLDGSYDCIHIDSLSFSTTAVLADSGPCDQYFSAPSNSLVIGDAVFLKGGVVTKGKNTTSGDSLANWIVVEKSTDSVRLAQCGVWIFNHGGIDGMTFFQGVNFPTIDPSSLDWNKPLYRGVGTGEIEILVGQRAIGKSVQDITNIPDTLKGTPRSIFFADADSLAVTLPLLYVNDGGGIVVGEQPYGLVSIPNLTSGIFNYGTFDLRPYGQQRKVGNLQNFAVADSLSDAVETTIYNGVMKVDANGSATSDYNITYLKNNFKVLKNGFPSLDAYGASLIFQTAPIDFNHPTQGMNGAFIGGDSNNILEGVPFVRFDGNIDTNGGGNEVFTVHFRNQTRRDGVVALSGQLRERYYGGTSLYNNTTVDGIPAYTPDGLKWKISFDDAVDKAIAERLHANNAAAAAVLAVGNFYYNTTDEKLTRVQ